MKKSILVLDDVIKDVSVLERISTLKVPTGTFIRKNEVLEPSDSNELNLLKRVIGEVWFNAAFDVISPIEDSLVGFEVWVNSLPDDFSREYLAGGMGGLNYHIDKDENALANSNGKNLIPSLYAATLYVSPDESEMVGGDIYVDTSGLDNYYKYYKGNYNCARVFPVLRGVFFFFFFAFLQAVQAVMMQTVSRTIWTT